MHWPAADAWASKAEGNARAGGGQRLLRGEGRPRPWGGLSGGAAAATAGAGGRVAATAAGTVCKSTVATAEGRRQELRDVGSAKLQDPSAKG